MFLQFITAILSVLVLYISGIDSKILSQQEKYEIELEIYNYTEYSLDFNNLVLNNIYRIALIINGGFSLSKFSLISEVQDEFFKNYKKQKNE